MKNYLIILCLIVLSGCAKKMHITDNYASTTKIKTTGDTSTHKSLLVVDKTKTFRMRQVDTIVTVAGGALSGYLSPLQTANDTSAYFENEDLSVVLNVNSLGYTRFIARSKPKKVPVQILEQTSVYNDVTTNEDAQVDTKSSTEVKTALNQTHSIKQSTPSTSVWFNLVLVTILAIVVIWLIRKMNLLKVLW
ncbi:hypothetical protein [Mucilaginibacter auburnensis]|uniref:Uncharacterized protein n=1 Tax=Mucilaginibacter auburnensis TaxID=1457233 RepID=A0A2H9VNQ0_9SPHI|nr:hypothetical protein [Mucilaginibacter auburnensis]PJJ79979.1 hypothetical protein CLV57_3118 [Mucilaginibacter auburnensis]